jgi:predicted AAA+ superfamily ATPase
VNAGVSPNTAKEWLSVLETSGIIFLLHPYFHNYGKRLVKTPKLYFCDTGLVCRLTGINTAEQLFLHPNRGALFETLVISELLKTRLNRGLSPDLYFWRDNNGVEVDAIQEEGGAAHAFEIKSGATFVSDWLSGLEKWRKYARSESAACALIYAGGMRSNVKDIRLIPWYDNLVK